MSRPNRQIVRSERYQEVLGYYRKRLWSAARARDAVDKGWITEEEYLIITRQNKK